MSEYYVHPKAICESNSVGAGTRIWAFTHVMEGAKIGRDCNIGEGCFIEGGARLGDSLTVKNGVAIWDRVTIEDYVFLGPNCVFTNDRVPRSHPEYRTAPQDWQPTRARTGCTIGANATIICGVTLGDWSFVAGGAVVVHDVPAYAMVAGNPARQIAWICRCGRRLSESSLACSCGLSYSLRDGRLGEA